jgi:GNAT superfamily N-acetyltransferase
MFCLACEAALSAFCLEKVGEMGTSDVTVKPVDHSNLQQAIEMAVTVFGEDDRDAITLEFRASLGMEPERSEVSADLNIHDLKFFLAYKNGEPVGVTGYYNFEDHQEDMWLDWIGVDPHFLRQGIGSVLVTEAFNQAAQSHKDARNFRIWTTTKPGNDAARVMYRKLGFVEEAYKPTASATDGASMIAVFTKAAQQPPANDNYLWKDSVYPIDAEKFEIPKITKELASKGGKPDLTP